MTHSTTKADVATRCFENGTVLMRQDIRSENDNRRIGSFWYSVCPTLVGQAKRNGLVIETDLSDLNRCL